jgi:hypothetical protein
VAALFLRCGRWSRTTDPVFVHGRRQGVRALDAPAAAEQTFGADA